MLYCIKQCVEHGNKNVFSIVLKYFDLKDGVSNCFSCFYEDLNKIEQYMKQKIVDILSKCKLDFAYLSAYLANGANINFGKFISIYELLIKEKNLSLT